MVKLLDGESIEPLGGGISVIISKEHRFNTDTILLADFSKPLSGQKVAEFGSGCGAIPLLWLRETEPKMIFAVEIQRSACDIFKRSAELNGLQNRINIINSDLKSLNRKIGANSLDLVVCNPPYKQRGTGLINSNEARTIARHEYECTIDDIVFSALKLLKFSGKLCMCQRQERLCDVICSMRNNGIEPKKLRFVQHKINKNSKLFLIEGRKGSKPGITVMPNLIIENSDGSKTDEFERIYSEYSKGTTR